MNFSCEFALIIIISFLLLEKESHKQLGKQGEEPDRCSKHKHTRSAHSRLRGDHKKVRPVASNHRVLLQQ